MRGQRTARGAMTALIVVAASTIGLWTPTAAQAAEPTATFTTVPTAWSSQPVGGLTATAHADDWSPTPDSVSYQWMLDDHPIDGATAHSYAVPAGDQGEQLAVAITAHKVGYADSTATSPDHVVLGQLTHTAGGLQVTFGATMATVSVAGLQWSPSDVHLDYHWYGQFGQLTDSTDSPTRQVSIQDAYNTSVQVIASHAGYVTSTLNLSAGNPSPGTIVPGTVNLSGTASVYGVLSADPVAWQWKPLPTSWSYQWMRNGTAIADATDRTYRLLPADQGARITARVTGHLDGSPDVTVISTSTNAITPPNWAPATPTLTGTAQIGSALTAHVGHWSPAVYWIDHYDWYVAGVLDPDQRGAKFYPDTDSDIGKSVTVRVVAGGNPSDVVASPLSAHSGAIVSGRIHAPTVRIRTPHAGEPTEFSIGGVAASWPVTYRWTASGKHVSTASDYAPDGSVVGKTLKLTVTVSVPGYASVSATSAGERVKEGYVTGFVSIEGTPTVGQPAELFTDDVWPRANTLSITWYHGSGYGRAKTKIGTGASFVFPASVGGKMVWADVVVRGSGVKTDDLPTRAVTVHPGQFVTVPTPTVDGTGLVGTTLRASSTGWNPTSPTLLWQWYTQSAVGGTLVPIHSATSATLVVPPTAAGQTIFVKVTAEHPGYDPASSYGGGIAVPPAG